MTDLCISPNEFLDWQPGPKNQGLFLVRTADEFVVVSYDGFNDIVVYTANGGSYRISMTGSDGIDNIVGDWLLLNSNTDKACGV